MNVQKPIPAEPKVLLILICLLTWLLFAALNSYGQDTGRIDNPVLPGVADAGVLYYNGEYYIGGVFTNGSFYRSADLVNWEGPFHVFSMDNDWTEGPSAHDSQIHASDIHYLNGHFHYYWSVNYWGEDSNVVHIGHAVSPHVLGPYTEPVKDTWLANRIDPHLFRDRNGKLYLYMVKFTDGNTIWARPMKDPATFSGEPRYLFASLPGTWETFDNRVAEGPWVIRYRNRYYLMYNANHTSPAWGNYSLGVAEAGGPLEFNHGSKYPHPVVASNQTDLEDLYPDLLKFAAHDRHLFHYTFNQPGENWDQADYDDSTWQKGKPGFGSAVIRNSTTRQVKTPWKTDRIWVRKSFHMDKDAIGNLSLRMHHNGKTTVFLNGEFIYSSLSRDYAHWNFDEKAISLMKEGENLLAIESYAGDRSGFLDVSLFDMRGRKAGDILFSPGQPNILRGPNGFEWWLVYMANKNAERRGQYINRVHFFDKKLTVDGITSIKTPGYHPAPALPTFGDLFNDTTQATGRKHKWQTVDGNWKLESKELVQTGPAAATATPRTRPAAHYLFEVAVKIKTGPGAKNETPAPGNAAAKTAGIYAFKKDEDNWLKILLDPLAREWTFELTQNGDLRSSSSPLPDDFDFGAYHKISVYKNAGEFRVNIDGLPAPLQPLIEATGLAGQGLPGLFTSGAGAAFDGVLYTIGWDEFDRRITGWKTAPGTIAEAGGWHVSDAGISSPGKQGANSPAVAIAESAPATDAPAEHAIFKGDLLDCYEFSVQVSSAGTAGIYPVYIDQANYLKAVFDYRNQELVISGKKRGEFLETQRHSLESLHPVYADMKYTDFIEKHFAFDAPTWINALRFSKTPYERPDTLINDLYRKMNIFCQLNGRWHLLNDYREVPSSHPGFDKIDFSPVKVTAVKLVNKQPTDHHFYTYKLWTNELFRDSYNLRVSKLPGEIIFWVNGKEAARMAHAFPASRVGLVAGNARARFNGIVFFNRPPR